MKLEDHRRSKKIAKTNSKRGKNKLQNKSRNRRSTT